MVWRVLEQGALQASWKDSGKDENKVIFVVITGREAKRDCGGGERSLERKTSSGGKHKHCIKKDSERKGPESEAGRR